MNENEFFEDREDAGSLFECQTNPPQRILFADDDKDVRRFNVDVLMDSGYEVHAVEDGATAWDALQTDPDFTGLGLSDQQAAAFRSEAGHLVENYFRLEDPDQVRPVGIEVTLEARLGDLRLRGIIDRLDLTPDGELVVIDYKTGRAPSPAFEQAKMIGVHLYALLCEEVLGQRPVEVRLLHLKEPTIITARPSEQTLRGQRVKTLAVWSAIERACQVDDFRPKTSPLCNYCRFKPYCPAYGGDPAEAIPALRGADTGDAA